MWLDSLTDEPKKCSSCPAKAISPTRRYCRDCEAAAARRYYKKNKKTVLLRRKNHPVMDWEKEYRNARSRVSVAVKRGKLTQGACEECGQKEAPYKVILDLQKPLESILWYCRQHRSFGAKKKALSEAMPQPEVTSGGGYQIGKPGGEKLTFEAAIEMISLLPTGLRSQVYERARRGPMGLGLDVSSPMYRMNILALARQTCCPGATG